jgi:hypothetical protein
MQCVGRGGAVMCEGLVEIGEHSFSRGGTATRSAEFNYYNQSGNQNIISSIQAKVAHFEDKYPQYWSLLCGS